jgi:hypothetical protein
MKFKTIRKGPGGHISSMNSIYEELKFQSIGKLINLMINIKFNYLGLFKEISACTKTNLNE